MFLCVSVPAFRVPAARACAISSARDCRALSCPDPAPATAAKAWTCACSAWTCSSCRRSTSSCAAAEGGGPRPPRSERAGDGGTCSSAMPSPPLARLACASPLGLPATLDLGDTSETKSTCTEVEENRIAHGTHSADERLVDRQQAAPSAAHNGFCARMQSVATDAGKRLQYLQR
jgi:hypothetical protein